MRKTETDLNNRIIRRSAYSSQIIIFPSKKKRDLRSTYVTRISPILYDTTFILQLLFEVD